MNTNPTAKRILCYGDSLTNGFDPEIQNRLDSNKRWPGVLQELLGSDFEIIEEGLGGRTTNLDDPKSPYKNGLEYFPACILSHFPLDYIILMLGTNNLKQRFNNTPSQIAKSLVLYIDLIRSLTKSEEYPEPKILLMSPPHVIQSQVPSDWDFENAEIASSQLSEEIQKIATKSSVFFLDTSTFVSPSSVDGIHLNAESNLKLAQTLFKYLPTL